MSADNYFITDQNAVYFLTFTVTEWIDIFMRKEYKFRQDTNHAILLDTSEMINQRINYTHENPVRALIVAEPHEYLFSSARDYSGDKGYVKVLKSLLVLKNRLKKSILNFK